MQDLKFKISKLRRYIHNCVDFNQRQNEIEQSVRNRVKWIFDYTRNLMTVGVLIFLGKVSHSQTLMVVGWVGSGLLWAFLMSYFEPITIRPFHLVKNRKLGEWLDIVFFFAILVPLGVALQYGVHSVANQIADAYLSRT